MSPGDSLECSHIKKCSTFQNFRPCTVIEVFQITKNDLIDLLGFVCKLPNSQSPERSFFMSKCQVNSIEAEEVYWQMMNGVSTMEVKFLSEVTFQPLLNVFVLHVILQMPWLSRFSMTRTNPDKGKCGQKVVVKCNALKCDSRVFANHSIYSGHFKNFQRAFIRKLMCLFIAYSIYWLYWFTLALWIYQYNHFDFLCQTDWEETVYSWPPKKQDNLAWVIF